LRDETIDYVAKNSSISPLYLLLLPTRWVVSAGAGVGGFYLFQLIRRLMYRAVHPDMEDPGKRYLRWLWLVPIVLTVVVAAAAAALFHRLGPGAIVLVVICAFLALLVWGIVASWLWFAAEQCRRASRYVICEADYADAPRQIKSTMRRMYRSARSMRSGQAYRQNMFGDLELDQLVYSAAERAVLSSELSAAARDLRPDSAPGDRTVLDDANAQIRAISDELARVESALKRSATTADILSESIAEPERQRAATLAQEQADAEARARHDRARGHLEDVTTRASARLDLDDSEVEDRIGAVSAGFDEARQVSAKFLGDPTSLTHRQDEIADDSTSTTRDAVFKAARFTAGKAAKLSAATAKAGVEKIRSRAGNQSPRSENS
jgi:hypothetical protein